MMVATAAGFLVGGIFGFVVSILVLLMRQRRNEKLKERGEPPIRDAVRPPFELPCAILGGAFTMLAARWLPLSVALLFAAFLPTLLIIVAGVVIGRQTK